MDQTLHQPSVAIIIPTLNECENIDELLSAVLRQATSGFSLEILVADGGSTDGTRERVRKWEGNAPVQLISADGARGLAGDVLDAARHARADIVVVMDGDLSHPASAIADLVRPIADGLSDMVVGSRYVPGGATPDWPRRRRNLSRLGGIMAWPLTDLRDPMSGFFAVRKERLLAVDPQTIGFKIALEIIADGGDALRLTEVPIIFRDRVRGHTKIGSSQMIGFVRRLLVLAGGSVSLENATRFAVVGLVGLALDIMIFQLMFGTGFGLVTAHSVSFVAAVFCNYFLNAKWAFADPAQVRDRWDWQRFPRFIAVCLLAFALRGGVLAAAVELHGWPPQAAILLGVGAAAIINYFGNAFFVFPHNNPRMPPDVRWRVAAIGVLAYLLALRLVFIGLVDLVPEETYYWNYAQHLDIGYLDHPPMVAWLIWAGTTIFGNNEFGVRIAAYLTWLGTAFFVFRLSRNMFGKSAAIVSVLLVSVMPFFFSTGFLMMPDVPLTATWAGTLYFLERALIGNHRRAWWGVGIFAGLGMLSKYTIALLGPAALLFILLDPRARRWFFRPEPYLAVLVAALIFSPAIYWNAMHAWASFVFQGSRRLEDTRQFSLASLIVSAIVLLTPTGFVAAIVALIASRDGIWSIKGRGFERRRGLFIATFTLVPLSVFVAFSVLHESKPNWTGPLWLALIPAIAAAIAGTAGGSSAFESLLQRFWAPTVVTTLVVYGLLLHYLVLGFPMVGYAHNIRTLPIAWEEFGKSVAEIEHSVVQSTGKDALLIGMDRYFITSEMAFYVRQHQDSARDYTGRVAVGGDSLMYDYWFKPGDTLGRTAILVALKKNDLQHDSLPQRFSELSEIKEQKVTKQGVPVGSFFYRVGYGLRNCLPSTGTPCASTSGD
jgi:dolichol-phosphate mannosyltransferase